MSQVFSITSKQFSIFNNMTTPGRAAHITTTFLTCYSCSYYRFMHQKKYIFLSREIGLFEACMTQNLLDVGQQNFMQLMIPFMQYPWCDSTVTACFISILRCVKVLTEKYRNSKRIGHYFYF